jgi:hypothetical protein
MSFKVVFEVELQDFEDPLDTTVLKDCDILKIFTKFFSTYELAEFYLNIVMAGLKEMVAIEDIGITHNFIGRIQDLAKVHYDKVLLGERND